MSHTLKALFVTGLILTASTSFAADEEDTQAKLAKFQPTAAQLQAGLDMEEPEKDESAKAEPSKTETPAAK
ncbi:hypothetical protein [Thiosulfativibrio zosterae]|uniref:Uncharacterized protein n=1 Tax=Thiosulfativibrio zosterae TaxID=2675053 RepID=A0A6F8PP84_9GAMM|nr:hypothetical protein [Thiosulfativibrio zosterae]BBP43848.1 hypothetical protein THMIRHAT_15940 [Thiosulfativibrio zosterae]